VAVAPKDDARKNSRFVKLHRLHEASESDHWWTYGTSDSEAKASVASLVDIYRRRGALFFAKFEPFLQVFEQITRTEMDAGDLSNMPPGNFTQVLAILTMARIMNDLRHHQKCRGFAEVGLRHLGGASGLRAAWSASEIQAEGHS